jgi:hypothetical protein
MADENGRDADMQASGRQGIVRATLLVRLTGLVETREQAVDLRHCTARL